MRKIITKTFYIRTKCFVTKCFENKFTVISFEEIFSVYVLQNFNISIHTIHTYMINTGTFFGKGAVSEEQWLNEAQ